jgi:hypothetical protein
MTHVNCTHYSKTFIRNIFYCVASVFKSTILFVLLKRVEFEGLKLLLLRGKINLKVVLEIVGDDFFNKPH